jgi:phosphatidylserine/phosphatidylglycerophosphate/cardiolipin synthase-like enzyme
LPELEKLERCFSSQFKLKLLETHEKFLVCDKKFAVVGNHNILVSNVNSEEREVGLRTDAPLVIAALIERFENP